MLYWPEFNFDFRLDIQRLLPHIAALGAYQEAACNRVRPPQWREQSAPEDTEIPSSDLLAQPRTEEVPIATRKQELLIRNASMTQAWVRARFVPGSTPLSLADILNMHRMVAEESGVHYKSEGVMRSAGVQVGRREVGGLHAGAPPQRLPRLMDMYIQFINGKQLRSLPPVVHGLVAHFFFTTIHPFDDGNGRLCRLVSAAILFQRGYNGHGFYALSNYFYDNEIKYHSLLHCCWQQPLPFDLTPFVAFGMEGMALELQGINSFIKMKLHRNADRETLAPARNRRRSARRGRVLVRS
jgi:cell filamentation protein, protein adenylyltransferase